MKAIFPETRGHRQISSAAAAAAAAIVVIDINIVGFWSVFFFWRATLLARHIRTDVL